MLQSSCINPRAKHVCSVCMSHFSDRSIPSERNNESVQNDQSDTEMVDDENDILSAIQTVTSYLKTKQWKEIDDETREHLISLAESLGKVISKDIYEDGKTVSCQYKDTDTLNSIENRRWLENRNACLLKFLTSATKVNIHESSPKKLNALTHLIEQTLYTRNLNIVTPFSFKRNLVLHSVTGSKLAVQLQSSWEGSGSYTNVHDMITAKVPENECPSGDIHNTIDNNQKVGLKTWRIREGSTVPLSICTTLGHIVPQPVTNLQEREDLMPKYWLAQSPNSQILEDVEKLEEQALLEFRNYRAAYIEECIENVKFELENRENGHDYVDIAISNEGKVNTCQKCCNTYKKESTVCSTCGNNDSLYEIGFDPYYRTTSKNKTDPPLLKIGEPCMVNPNSISSVREVLEHVKIVTKITDDAHPRIWTFVHSDGVPYNYASDIQDFFYKCNFCGEEVNKKGITEEEWLLFLKDHEKKENHNKDYAFDRVIDNLIFIPGPGHIELNMARLLLKLLWEPFLSHIARQLGFRSPKALEVVKKGVDHHRSRRILESCLEALSKELLVPYVRNCQRLNESPSQEGYLEFVKKVNDESYLFLYSVTFSYLLAFHLYTESTRKNHSIRMLAARSQIAPLFYSFPHPKYQQLHLRDLCQRVQMPTSLQEYLVENESFSVTGISNRAQGADFIHEEINKLVKSFLPPGMPSNETWQRVCRKANDFKKMKDSALNLVLVEKKSYPKSEQVVTLIRREIRSNYFLSDLCKPLKLQGIDGKYLDSELVDIKHVAKENYQSYKQNYLKTKNFSCKVKNPVFITEESRIEAEKIEKKTKSEIVDEIKLLFASFPDQQSAIEMENEFCSTSKKMKHQCLVDYYNSIKLLLEDQQVNEDVCNVLENVTGDHEVIQLDQEQEP